MLYGSFVFSVVLPESLASLPLLGLTLVLPIAVYMVALKEEMRADLLSTIVELEVMTVLYYFGYKNLRDGLTV